MKRLLVGRPIPTEEQEHQLLPKLIALATFSSDAISSTAYATEEILFVTAVTPSTLALGVDHLIPISIVVAFLLTIVVTSYLQTILSSPSGGHRRHPRAVHPPEGLLIRRCRPHRRRGHLQWCSCLPATEVPQRRQDHRVDGRDLGRPVLRRVGAGPPSAPLPEPRRDRDLRD